jgi:hypothetical protein
MKAKHLCFQLRQMAHAVFALLLLFSATAASAEPFNDNWPGTVLPVNPGTLVNQTNAGATVEAGEPTDYNSSKSVWYNWTPAISGDVQLNTCGEMDFDPTLGVYTGSAVNALTTLALNDDSCGLGSRVEFTATAGTTYYFRFGGFVDREGTADIYWGYQKAISSLSVSSGPLDGGTEVTITGIGFTDTTSVTFGGVAGTNLVVVSDTSITVTTPAGLAEGSVDVVVSGPGGNGALLDGFTYIEGTPATEFAANQDQIRQVIIDESMRNLRSAISSNRNMVQAARERFAADAGQTETVVTRNYIPFDVDGAFSLSGATLSTNGTFFGQSGSADGTWRRLFFGDFNVQRDGNTGSNTATLSARVAWEQMVSDTTMLGYFIGAELADSDIRGSFAGDQNRVALTLGGYAVHELAEQVYLDGFLTLGAGRNDLSMANDVLALESDYTTRTATLGAALSGIYAYEAYEFHPELSFSYGHTWIGNVGFTGRAYGLVDNTLSLDAGNVSMANLIFRPEVIWGLDGETVASSTSQLSFAPRMICEQTRALRSTNDCGGGAELGLSTQSDDGLTNAEFRVLMDRVGSSERTSYAIILEHRF